MATENNKTRAPFASLFTPEDHLFLPCSMPFERSLLLEDGAILTACVDAQGGAFTLARHLKSGWLDHDFGRYGVQRVTSDIARSVTTLALRLEPSGHFVMQGNLSDPVTGRKGVYLLRVLPDASTPPCLGVDAFLIVSLLPTAGAERFRDNAVNEWTWLRWPCQQNG